jgi:rsbT antagonist protein RsbS
VNAPARLPSAAPRGGFRTPIVRLYQNLIVPIQGTLADGMVADLQEQVAERVMSDDAKGLIIDVSAVDVMDSYVTRIVRDLALTARLMGVRTVLSGVQVNVAITMIEMGMELSGVKTTLNLERALEHLAELEESTATFEAGSNARDE